MKGIIGAFAAHRVAPNLLLILMIASGIVIANRIDTRFFPKFEIQVIRVSAAWTGAAAEDVVDSLIVPMENELRNVPNLKEITSSATQGRAQVYLEFPDSINLDDAAEDVRRYLDLAAGDLPEDSDPPEIFIIERPERLLFLSLTGDSITQLRPLARRVEAELLKINNIQVEVKGLPKDTIEIRFNQRALLDMGLTPAQVGAQLSASNIDVSAGDVSGDGGSRLIRANSKKKAVSDLADIAIVDGRDNILRLGDIADIRRRADPDAPTYFVNGKPAAQFQIVKPLSGNALAVARQVLDWRDEFAATLPLGIELRSHQEEWRLIESRLNLLLDNGLQGLLLVLLLLFLFLNSRLAFWVALGIPATFMTALACLYFYGGSINMITMFAFIMTTGIVVDDAIVVSENGHHHFKQGKPPLQAAVDGAREMFPSVFASTFTTIASFMPLLVVGGPIGSILFVIPLVVICVLLAALFECFTVLPGHMAMTFKKLDQVEKEKKRRSKFRDRMENAFDRFQEGPFRRLSHLSLRYRWVTLAAAFTILVASISLFIGGAVKYRFFPGADLDRARINIEFFAGTPKETVVAYTEQLRDYLYAELDDFPEGRDLIEIMTIRQGLGAPTDDDGPAARGDEVASMLLELMSSDRRVTRVSDIIRKWNANPPRHPSLSQLNFREQRGGPPGEDLQVRLAADSLTQLKSAAQALVTALPDIPGVSLPSDDMPFGKKQIIFELTALGRSLNLSVRDIAAQLRNAFDGYNVQTFYEGVDQVDVKVMLAGGDSIEQLAGFQARLPNGELALLTDVVRLSSKQGFDSIQRVNREAVANIIGKVDFEVTDVATVIRQLESTVLPAITERYAVSYSFAGAQEDETETAADMQTGLLVSFVLIFIILAAVFSSWSLPIIILLTAPLGVIGAIWGHLIMGYEMSILSMFGIFTLNGIVINDSIILVRDYLARRARDATSPDNDVIVDAVCRRLRAILLTSLTTIFGLVPLMFETSTQAQFLIPMAISIAFGLAFATLLILFVMPAYLSIATSIIRALKRLSHSPTPAQPAASTSAPK